jgi:hypothetical protein
MSIAAAGSTIPLFSAPIKKGAKQIPLGLFESRSRYVLMTAVAEGLSRGPSQIKSLVAVLIAILPVKGMAGDAYDPALVVKKHIGGDLDGRDRAHGMRPHFISAVMPLMAGVAYCSDVVAE